jgi:hypothetical protein
MSFYITPIIVMIDTPNSKQPIELTNDMIYHPLLTELNNDSGKAVQLTSKNPVFTNEVKYPLSILRKYSYPNIVKFFFNQDYFRQKLSEFILSGKTKVFSAGKKSIEEFKNENGERNVAIMLKLLFPSSMIGSNFYSDSYNEYIQSRFVGDLSISDYFQSNNFSYLKINGKINTVVKVTFLNDLLNHPVYKETLKTVFRFFEWQKKEIIRIENLLTEKQLNLLTNLVDTNDRSNSSYFILDDVFIDQFKKNMNKYDKLLQTNQNLFGKQDYFVVKNSIQNIINYIDTIKNSLVNRNINLLTDNIGLDKSLINENIRNHFTAVLGNGVDTKELNQMIEPILLAAQNLAKDYFFLLKKEDTRLDNISTKFVDRLSRLNKETENLLLLNRIKTNYFGEVPNLNIGGEVKEIVDKLNTEFSHLTEFIGKLNDILEPKRKCSNIELQKMIYEATKTAPKIESLDSCNITNFFNFIRIINDEMIYVRSKTKCMNSDVKNLLKVGVCYIDTRSKNTAEIYVSVDLIEGEVNDKNVDKIKCAYRDRYLTQELKTVFSLVRAYFRDPHKTIMTAENIQREGIQLNEPNKKKGGKSRKICMTGKYSNLSKKDKSNKTRKKE